MKGIEKYIRTKKKLKINERIVIECVTNTIKKDHLNYYCKTTNYRV